MSESNPFDYLAATLKTVEASERMSVLRAFFSDQFPSDIDAIRGKLIVAGVELPLLVRLTAEHRIMAKDSKNITDLLAMGYPLHVIKAGSAEPTAPMPVEDPGINMTWAWNADSERWYKTAKV
jgi:hypothetical protein